MAAEFQALLGAEGTLFAPKTLEELDAAAAVMRDEPPAVLAVHGGDGTLHRLLTALGRTFGDAPLPPIAILGGGTMNVVSASLGLREAAQPFLTGIVAAVRAGRPLEWVQRRCLRFAWTPPRTAPQPSPEQSGIETIPGSARPDGDTLGFIFGNGLMANFLTEYYGTGSYGPARAAWLLVRAAGSAMVGGPFMRRLFKRFEGTVEVDGHPLERQSFVGIGAATVREVGLGFKLNHRADDDPERFGVLAIHARAVSLIPDFWSVHAGRGIAPGRAFSAVASALRITPKEGTMPYTIDGDLYLSEGPVSISLGPHVRFVKPLAALQNGHARPAPALIAAKREDTMESTR